GNPHVDNLGNAAVWTFVRGPSTKSSPKPASMIPVQSVLGKWRAAAADPDRRADWKTLGREVETLLTGPQPANDKDGNRALYDLLVTADSPLFNGVDVAKIVKRLPNSRAFGLPKVSFAVPDGDSLSLSSDKVVEIRLPAALFV